MLIEICDYSLLSDKNEVASVNSFLDSLREQLPVQSETTEQSTPTNEASKGNSYKQLSLPKQDRTGIFKVGHISDLDEVRIFFYVIRIRKFDTYQIYVLMYLIHRALN